MKKLTLLLSLIIVTSSAFAQEMLDTVIVTANRAQGTLQTATRTVEVMNKESLENTPAITTNEILESIASVDVRQRSTFDVQSDISIRGGTFDQTLILLNGIRMNDPQTGHHNMNLPISLDLISQIEVLEGGGSRIYGPNAFSGAVNFQTALAGKNKYTAQIAGGAYGLRQMNLGATFNVGKWYNLISVNGIASDGYIRNTDFSNFNVYAQTAGKLKIGTLLVSAGFNKKAFGAQDFYSSRYPEQFESTQTIFTSAKLFGGKNWKYSVLAYWRQHNDKFELFREDANYYKYNNGFFIKGDADTAKYVPGVFQAWNYYPGHNYHQTRVTGAEGQLKRIWKKAGTTTFGIDYRNEQILSNNLGKPLSEPIAIPGERGEYTKSDARDNYAFYAEHFASFGKFLVTVGALANYNTAFGTDLMPGLDFGYRIKPNWLVFASIDRSFRLPTYTDLYYSLGGAQGSSTLQPEYSLNYELGSRYSTNNFMGSVALFMRKGQNMIDWVQWKPDSIHAENLTEVTMKGFSASASYQLSNYTKGWIKHVDAGYTFLISDQEESDLQSIYVLDYLQNKVNLGLTHKLFLDALTINWRVSYQDRNGDYFDFKTQETVSYQNFWLTDARINYTYKFARLFVEASNLFNVQYVDRGNVTQPGRWLSVGLSLQF